jgi:hypothetical protein
MHSSFVLVAGNKSSLASGLSASWWVDDLNWLLAGLVGGMHKPVADVAVVRIVAQTLSEPGICIWLSRTAISEQSQL